MDYVVRRVDQIEDSLIVRDRGRPIKTIKKYLEINELNQDMLYNRRL